MTDIKPIHFLPRRTAPLAVQFTGGEEHTEKVRSWLSEYAIKSRPVTTVSTSGALLDESLEIRTHLHGMVEAFPGDWIILQPNGEVTIMDDAQRKATYFEYHPQQ